MIAVIKAILGGAWGFLRAIPWQVWAVAALLAFGWWYGASRYRAGEDDATARFAVAQDQANREAIAAAVKRDADARKIDDESSQRAATAVADTRAATAAASERARYESHAASIPAGCPVGLPVRVRDEGRAAVDRARAAGSSLREGRNP